MNDLGIPFDFAKPSTLVEYLMEVSRSDGDSLILDFFGGSGTTAQAVMSANAADGGNRRWIIVQLDEMVDEGREAATRGFRTIPELARERIRRAGAKTLEKMPAGKDPVDVGFRAFHIDDGNFLDARVTPQQASQDALAGVISHIRDDRSEEDLLFGALLRWGVDISLQVERREIADRTIWLVDPPTDGNEGAALIACFARPQQGKNGIDTELADAIARMKPLRVLFRDDGFTSDSVMENVQSRFKQLAPDTDVKVL
jgi:adenine-specific DNA-methyltransferase